VIIERGHFNLVGVLVVALIEQGDHRILRVLRDAGVKVLAPDQSTVVWPRSDSKSKDS